MPNFCAVYVAKRASVLTNPITTDSIFCAADNAAQSAFVGIPSVMTTGKSNIEAFPFMVRASGKVHVPTTSSTLIVTLYYATKAKDSITYNATGVSTTGATFTSASMTAAYNSNWLLQATFVWDYTSKILNGYFSALSGPTPVLASQAVTTQITSVDLTSGTAGFIVGAHLGSSGADTTVTLSNFSLEAF